MEIRFKNVYIQPRALACFGQTSPVGRSSWRILVAGLLFTVAFAISACGGSSGGGIPEEEGKGFPGDTTFAETTVREYYINNGLVDPPIAPGTVLPSTVSNEKLLTANVPNQGLPGTCAGVTFAQMVYGTDVAAAAIRPFLDNVQYSYLFARYFQNNGKGGLTGWPDDSGSFAYTNFVALTNSTYRANFTNGFVPADGEEGKGVMNPTGVFFPFPDSPNISNPISIGEGKAKVPNLDSYWNDINLWKNLNAGPTTMTITIRRAEFSPTSLDVKALVAAGKLVFFAMDTNDSKNQWGNAESSLTTTGVLKLPYQEPAEEPEPGGHAMVIVGYDDAGYGKYGGAGAFKLRNSWSSEWGNTGFWYLPYSIIDGVAGAPDGKTYPLYYDENFVYISALHHN
jgi:hypothetical protein